MKPLEGYWDFDKRGMVPVQRTKHEFLWVHTRDYERLERSHAALLKALHSALATIEQDMSRAERNEKRNEIIRAIQEAKQS